MKIELNCKNNIYLTNYYSTCYPAAPKSEYNDEKGDQSDEYLHIKYSMRYFV